MTEEFSAGGIIFRQNSDGTLQILLIKNAALRDPTKAYWGFPKGHLENDESEEQAAIREIKEETDLDVEIVEKIDDEKYYFTHPQKGKIFKQVSYFKMNYLSGEAKAQESELLALDWFEIDQAFNQLTFKNDKNLLKKALGEI